LSRVGKKPITIPSGVEVNIHDEKVTVKGSLGELFQVIDDSVKLQVNEGSLILTSASDKPECNAKHGLYRNLLNNMVKGVSTGFEKTLKIIGVGYRAIKKGEDLEILIGYSSPVTFKKPSDVSFDLPDATTIVVKGIDKQRVGQIASQIRNIRRPEPYKGKGIRYSGELVRKKVGKTAVAGKGVK